MKLFHSFILLTFAFSNMDAMTTMTEQEALNILELKKPYTEEDIKKAYKKLAITWHPDKWKTATPAKQQTAENTMREINSARDDLLNYYLLSKTMPTPPPPQPTFDLSKNVNFVKDAISNIQFNDIPIAKTQLDEAQKNLFPSEPLQKLLIKIIGSIQNVINNQEFVDTASLPFELLMKYAEVNTELNKTSTFQHWKSCYAKYFNSPYAGANE